MIENFAEVSPVAQGTLFETFDLAVHLGPELIPWISASSRIGHVRIPRGDAGLPALNDLLDFVYDYTDAVYFAEREPAPEISRILEKLVFGDPLVLELFQATRAAAGDRGRQFLVRILASPHLAVLPWELLPDPGARQAGQRGRFALIGCSHLLPPRRGGGGDYIPGLELPEEQRGIGMERVARQQMRIEHGEGHRGLCLPIRKDPSCRLR